VEDTIPFSSTSWMKCLSSVVEHDRLSNEFIFIQCFVVTCALSVLWSWSFHCGRKQPCSFVQLHDCVAVIGFLMWRIRVALFPKMCFMVHPFLTLEY
jgi:hypothetical protein